MTGGGSTFLTELVGAGVIFDGVDFFSSQPTAVNAATIMRANSFFTALPPLQVCGLRGTTLKIQTSARYSRDFGVFVPGHD